MSFDIPKLAKTFQQIEIDQLKKENEELRAQLQASVDPRRYKNDVYMFTAEAEAIRKAIRSAVDELRDWRKGLSGLDNPTEFALSQAKTFAISVALGKLSALLEGKP